MPATTAPEAVSPKAHAPALRTEEAVSESMPEEEFREAIISHLGAMYRLGMALSRQPASAEDLVQETALKALRNRHQFRRGTNLKAWLLTILRNAHINRYRRERRAPVAVDFADLEPLIPARAAAYTTLPVRDRAALGALGDRLDERLVEAVEDLSDDFREVFLLAVLEELAYKEIAALLGIPIGTVMSRLFRARHRLKEQLEEHAGDLGIPPLPMPGASKRSQKS